MLSSLGLHSRAPQNPENAVVVVGSGPPAAAAALVLSKAGLDVLILEAGLPEAARGLTFRVAGLTVARIHRTLGARTGDLSVTGDPRSILFEDVSPGGLTNHWSCAVPRFSRDDFADARRAGEQYAWPIDYDDLAPWYDWVEPYLCMSGTTTDFPQLPAGKVADVTALAASWTPIGDAARRDGQALLPVPYVYGARTTLTISGTVFNSFVRLLKPLMRDGRVAVRFGAKVTSLEWNGTRR